MASWIRKKKLMVLVLCIMLLGGTLQPVMATYAQGPEYTAEPKPETYYTKEDCVVYAEPTYTSTILTTIGANVPVQVIGSYSNGWYRINIGVICYVKMDSLTTAGAIGIKNNADVQIADAKKIADEMGYQFVYLTLNKEKKIEKEIFNSYIGQKVILYAKIDDEVGVSFKMLYNDEVKRDINLKYTKQVTPPPKPADGIPRTIELTVEQDTELKGQIAIFQFKVGYDKKVNVFTADVDTGEFLDDPMAKHPYYTEFSEFAYAPMTQVYNMRVEESEIANSLTDTQRQRTARIRQGIKYLDDDNKSYRDSVHGKLRKDTEYVDYNY